MSTEFWEVHLIEFIEFQKKSLNFFGGECSRDCKDQS